MITIDDIDIFLLSYNREKYILEMVQSLKNQTIGEFEIKILDNGSSDNTEKIIEKLNDNKIIFIGSDKNNGALWNFQRAQRLATKKYTIMLHDDDLLHPNYFEYVIKALNENKNISLVCSGMTSTINPLNNNFKKYSYNPIIYEQLSDFIALVYLGFPLNFATAVYKTENLKKVKIDFETYGKIGDRPLMYDTVQGENICFFPGQYIQYRIHQNQDSGDSKTGPFYNETIALHKKYKDIIFSSRSAISKLFFLINFYRYLKEEYGRFYDVKISFDKYLELALKETNLLTLQINMSKLFYFFRIHYFFKVYRAIKRRFGEYS